MHLSWDDVAWARLRRSGLLEPFDAPVEVARALIGVQSQFVPPAGLAIDNRLAADFTASDLNTALHDGKELLRLWGQRNTVHIYDPADWGTLVAIHGALPSYRERLTDRLGRTVEEFEAAVDRVEAILRGRDSASRSDFIAADASLEPWLRDGNALVMTLVRRGLACHAALVGGRSHFAHREVWLPELEWSPPETEDAGAALARRYLATYGPASERDFAFWLGCKMGDAKRWIASLDEEVVRVDVDGTELLDLDGALVGEAPPRSKWPTRLLHRFEPLVLAHKDKTWIAADRHYKAIWRKAGYVEAFVLERGRIAGTWGYEKKRGGVGIWIEPFERLSKKEAARLGRAAERVAAYFEAPLLAVTIR